MFLVATVILLSIVKIAALVTIIEVMQPYVNDNTKLCPKSSTFIQDMVISAKS